MKKCEKSKISNLDYGNRCEDKYKFRIEKDIGYSITKTERYSKYDYVNEEKGVYIELKSRRYTGKTYTSHMVTKKKFIYLQQLASVCDNVWLYYAIGQKLYKYRFNENSTEDLIRKKHLCQSHIVHIMCRDETGKLQKNILIDASKGRPYEPYFLIFLFSN